MGLRHASIFQCIAGKKVPIKFPEARSHYERYVRDLQPWEPVFAEILWSSS
jgi:hypothetical protein